MAATTLRILGAAWVLGFLALAGCRASDSCRVGKQPSIANQVSPAVATQSNQQGLSTTLAPDWSQIGPTLGEAQTPNLPHGIALLRLLPDYKWPLTSADTSDAEILAMNPVPVPDPPVGLATQELVASPPPLPEHLVIPKEAPIKAIPATPAETLPTGLASPPNFAIFGHAHDYRWISGEAQKWDDGWRLRYAMPDEIDPYGGRIALVGEEHLWHLQDGEFYKLVGRLVPVDGQAGGVAFHVDIVQLAAANISSAEPATVPLNQIK